MKEKEWMKAKNIYLKRVYFFIYFSEPRNKIEYFLQVNFFLPVSIMARKKKVQIKAV